MGENLQGLLDRREAGLGKSLAMSDALSSNEVGDESLLIRCHCLARGRRKFSDLQAMLPYECQAVLDVISQVSSAFLLAGGPRPARRHHRLTQRRGA